MSIPAINAYKPSFTSHRHSVNRDNNQSQPVQPQTVSQPNSNLGTILRNAALAGAIVILPLGVASCGGSGGDSPVDPINPTTPTTPTKHTYTRNDVQSSLFDYLGALGVSIKQSKDTTATRISDFSYYDKSRGCDKNGNYVKREYVFDPAHSNDKVSSYYCTDYYNDAEDDKGYYRCEFTKDNEGLHKKYFISDNGPDYPFNGTVGVEAPDMEELITTNNGKVVQTRVKLMDKEEETDEKTFILSPGATSGKINITVVAINGAQKSFDDGLFDINAVAE